VWFGLFLSEESGALNRQFNDRVRGDVVWFIQYGLLPENILKRDVGC
jgi:hypothetical protein